MLIATIFFEVVRGSIYLLLLPLAMMLATPIILIGAAFSREGNYVENVKSGYGTVWFHWKRNSL